jgi:hypothetical protein
MFPTNDGGHYAEQGHVQEWQGRYGQGQSARVSRGEQWEIYRCTLAALQENLRRRDRANWFFLTASFAFFTTLWVVFSVLDHELVSTVVSLVALFVGAPMCLTWRFNLKTGMDLHEKNLKTVRKIEQEYGLPPLPFTVDEPPLATIGIKQTPIKDDEPSILFTRWEVILPNVCLGLFLVLFVFIWRDQIVTGSNWLWDQCLAAWDWLWPASGARK